MNDIPDEVRELVARREAARSGRDFARADQLREQIARAGFDVTDTPAGSEVAVRTPDPERVVYRRSDEVPSRLEEPPRFDASIQWVVQGWPEDVIRGIESFRRHSGEHSVHLVVVDLTGSPWPADVDVVHLDPTVGWAAGRNAGLVRADGRIVVMVDGAIEGEGDVVAPLVEALTDPSVGITGPFGIVSTDLREFRPSAGPEVDAVEGYLTAVRRDLVEVGLRYDEKFKFYRTADIELSFQVKAKGLRATVTTVPVRRHEHRMWANTPEDERDRLSKRNFYRFLDRWRGRTDLLVSTTRPDEPGSPGSEPKRRKR